VERGGVRGHQVGGDEVGQRGAGGVLAGFEAAEGCQLPHHLSHPAAAALQRRHLVLEGVDGIEVLLRGLAGEQRSDRLDDLAGGDRQRTDRREQAAAQLSVDEAKVEQEKASVIAAEAEAKRASADAVRYQSVGVEGVSQSQLDLSVTQARSAEANAAAVRDQEVAAETQIKLDQAAILTAEAEIKNSEAAVREADLNLSYTQVKAHEPGFVTHRTVEADSYVQPGQALLAIVPKTVWVVANFKETQLRHMRPGQPVTLRVDAYPQIAFTGHVDSIQAGTGPRFSLLPPENASGNYVKVVQRVPVKIVLDDNSRDGYVLGAGMSVVPEVRVQ